jgi:hypothetical protein
VCCLVSTFVVCDTVAASGMIGAGQGFDGTMKAVGGTVAYMGVDTASAIRWPRAPPPSLDCTDAALVFNLRATSPTVSHAYLPLMGGDDPMWEAFHDLVDGGGHDGTGGGDGRDGISKV